MLKSDLLQYLEKTSYEVDINKYKQMSPEDRLKEKTYFNESAKRPTVAEDVKTTPWGKLPFGIGDAIANNEQQKADIQKRQMGYAAQDFTRQAKQELPGMVTAAMNQVKSDPKFGAALDLVGKANSTLGGVSNWISNNKGLLTAGGFGILGLLLFLMMNRGGSQQQTPMYAPRQPMRSPYENL